MDILVTDTNEVAARAAAINRAPQGWLVDGAVYPGDLTLVAGVTIPDGLADKRLSYVGGEFVELPPIVDPQAPPVVPSIVSMRQARLALLQAGKLDDVDAAIAALPSPAKEAAQIEWEYATEVKRDSQLVTQLAPALGLDDAALNALFIAAAAL